MNTLERIEQTVETAMSAGASTQQMVEALIEEYIIVPRDVVRRAPREELG